MPGLPIDRGQHEGRHELSETHDQVVSFGPFRLFAARRFLERDGTPVRLSSRALDILVVLVAEAGKVVSKSDLIARAWPGITVDEANIRVQVAALRKALGDGATSASYISTIPGTGYCFVAPIFRAGVPHRPIRRLIRTTIFRLRLRGFSDVIKRSGKSLSG